MSIPGISSAGAVYQPGTTSPSSPSAQMSSYLHQLGAAIQSGNLSAAQQIYSQAEAALQAPASSAATGSAASQGSLVAHVLQSALARVGQDLQSGNLTAAQADFTSLQKQVHFTLNDPTQALQAWRHLHGGVATPAASTTSGTTAATTVNLTA